MKYYSRKNKPSDDILNIHFDKNDNIMKKLDAHCKAFNIDKSTFCAEILLKHLFTKEEMSERMIEYFSSPDLQSSFKKAAFNRADDYTADNILHQLLKDIGILTIKELHGTKTA